MTIRKAVGSACIVLLVLQSMCTTTYAITEVGQIPLPNDTIVACSPKVVGNNLLVGTVSDTGGMQCYDISSYQLVWSCIFDGNRYDMPSEATIISDASASGSIYAYTESNHKLYKVNLNTGDIEQSVSIDAQCHSIHVDSIGQHEYVILAGEKYIKVLSANDITINEYYASWTHGDTSSIKYGSSIDMMFVGYELSSGDGAVKVISFTYNNGLVGGLTEISLGGMPSCIELSDTESQVYISTSDGVVKIYTTSGSILMSTITGAQKVSDMLVNSDSVLLLTAYSQGLDDPGWLGRLRLIDVQLNSFSDTACSNRFPIRANWISSDIAAIINMGQRTSSVVQSGARSTINREWSDSSIMLYDASTSQVIDEYLVNLSTWSYDYDSSSSKIYIVDIEDLVIRVLHV